MAILDLELPDGDGADLIEDLHDRDPRIQTLVLSAHADRASVARAVQKGAAAVLGKTTHLHEVVSAVRRVRAGETLMELTRSSSCCVSRVAGANASWTSAG